jgi:hypothetical protein
MAPSPEDKAPPEAVTSVPQAARARCRAAGFWPGLNVSGAPANRCAPVEASYHEDDVPAQWSAFTADNARFLAESLPGHAEPLNSPAGAAKLGRTGADTPLVAGYPPRG